MVGVQVFGKCLFHVRILRCYPPLFLQLYFLKRLILNEICHKSLEMLGKAFCGSGFIHLNIAEFHEEDIGGQKKYVYFGN